MQFIVPLDARGATDAERVGPKAANLAALAHAGLPTPGGFCLDRGRLSRGRSPRSGSTRRSRELRRRRSRGAAPALGRDEARALSSSRSRRRSSSRCSPPGARSARRAAQPSAVRSSALVEDRDGANFAGQFESYLGIDDEAEFLTAVRACWAALWTTLRAATWRTTSSIPADTAMAVLIQPLVARARLGRRLERDRRRPDAAQRDLGARLGDRARRGGARPHRAQSRQGFLRTIEAGRKDHREPAATRRRRRRRRCRRRSSREPCLEPAQAVDARPPAAQGRGRCRHAGRDRVGARRRGLQAAAGAAAACRSRRTCRTRSGCSIPASTAIPPASAGAPAAPWWSTANASSRASRPATCW